jgi:hypothetical protein
MRRHRNFGENNLKGKAQIKDLLVDGMMILKKFLHKCNRPVGN